MKAKLILFSNSDNEINDFLNKFYSCTTSDYTTVWKKEFTNPVEISEFIAAYVDNNSLFNFEMWLSLDKDVFIKISPSNSNIIIKYLFERYPY